MHRHFFFSQACCEKEVGGSVMPQSSAFPSQGVKNEGNKCHRESPGYGILEPEPPQLGSTLLQAAPPTAGSLLVSARLPEGHPLLQHRDLAVVGLDARAGL